jgi:DNA mismatch repair protein MutL
MGRIHVLSDTLINRIAAGEVVERPASVVKEFVENSLDAGARAIEVRLEGGGKRLIEVSDDGHGMDRDDAVLAVERHATSKLSRAEDLDAIGTLGFRGEALASIAAVSDLTVRTATGDGAGTEVQVREGRVTSVVDMGLPRGTTIRVERLFAGTPVRRKFLRGDSTELSHCLRWLTRYALLHPDRRFRVESGSRTLLDTPATRTREERISQIHGISFTDKLLSFDLRDSTGHASGLAGRPVDSLPRRTAQHFFVNGRAVQDRVLSHAASRAYGNTMPHGRHAALFLFLELPADAVDVNVHPQKTEVRFRQSSTVHDLVVRAIRSSLSRDGAVPDLGDLRPESVAPLDAVRESLARYVATQPSAPREAWPTPRTESGPAVGNLVDAMQERDGERRHRNAVPLAQFRDSYIVAEDAEGLLLVDQHAAHERVLFEEYLAAAEENRVETQRLLFPVTFELTAHECAGLEDELDEFARLGFAVERFGGDAVRLDGIPAVAAGSDPETLFRELLGEAAEARSATAGVADLRRRLVTTAACHAAIKVNNSLTMEAMQGLLDRWSGVTNPSTCPHGRPAVFRLTQEQIERAFRRR